MTTQSPIFTGTAAVAALIIGAVWCLAWMVGHGAKACHFVDDLVDRAIDD